MGLKCRQTVIFILCYLCMIANHTSREAWYQVKPFVRDEWGFSETILGAFDSTFLLFYAAGLYMMGNIQDKLSIRLVMPIGMAFSALWIFLMGLFGFLNMPYVGIYFTLWALNGLAQAVVQPGTVDCIQNWFQARYKGFVMGAFSSSANFGNLMGTAVFSIVILGAGAHWASVTLATAVIMALIAASFAAFGHEKPSSMDRDSIQERSSEEDEDKSDEPQELTSQPMEVQKEGIGFFAAWKVPGVLLYACVFAFVKLVFYGMMMWLPYYVDEGLGRPDNDAIILANLFDFGSVLGAIGQGRIIDKFRHRNLILVPSLLATMPIFLSFRFISEDLFDLYFLLVPIVGFFIGGAANLIPSLIAADLGSNPDLNQGAVSTITGIIDGTGSFGAAIGQFVIGLLADHFGWDAAFVFLMMCCGIPGMLLLQKCMLEYKEYKCTEEKHPLAVVLEGKKFKSHEPVANPNGQAEIQIAVR